MPSPHLSLMERVILQVDASVFKEIMQSGDDSSALMHENVDRILELEGMQGIDPLIVNGFAFAFEEAIYEAGDMLCAPGKAEGEG